MTTHLPNTAARRPNHSALAGCRHPDRDRRRQPASRQERPMAARWEGTAQ